MDYNLASLAPFGTGSPAEEAQKPSGLANLLGAGYGYLGDLAKRAIGNSQTAMQTGYYNPAPVMEAATMMMGGSGIVPAEANTLRSGMSFFDDVAKKYPGVKIDGSVPSGSGYATLSRIEVPKDLRNQGVGSQVMKDLIAGADAKGIPLALSPSSDFGGNKSRLVDFYKRFGFVQNHGRNKDFTTRETMIRPPGSSE